MNEHLDYMAGVVRVMVGIQARMGSSRRPGKTLADLGGRPLLAFMLQRFRLIRTPHLLVVLTTELPEDDPIARLAERMGVVCVRGAETDLLARWWKAVQVTGSDIVVRTGADDPFIDPRLIDAALACYAGHHVATEGWPLGGNIYVLPRESIRIAAETATDPIEREHGEPFWQRRPRQFPLLRIVRHADAYQRRLTVDTEADLELHRRIAAAFAPRVDFSVEEIIDLLDANPEWEDVNRHVRQFFWDTTPVEA